MKAPVKTVDLVSQCKSALTRFWSGTLRVEPVREGVILALPLLYPEGLQVTISLQPVTEATAVLTDLGETLGTLANSGLNLEAKVVEQFIADRLQAFDLHRDGFILQKQIRLPVDGLDIHLFGEALVSLAHLIYRHEPEAAEENVSDRTVQRLFAERHLTPRRNALLEGHVAKRIQIDYYLEGRRGLALEVINRKQRLLPYMERWGWRWNDLREKHPYLIRAMVYDPDNQDWESSALAIGRSVCEVFCPYFDQTAVQKAITEAIE
jgi:hypothetical protein